MAGAELRAAIRDRNVVAFCLDALQVGAASSSGTLPGWRRFDLNAIDAVLLLDERFDVDDEFEVRARDYRRGIVVAAVDQ